MTRTDALITELSRRHDNAHPEFLAAVRPLVDRILEPGISDSARIELMEMLAETFERDVAIRRDLQRAQQGFDAFFAELRRILEDGR